MPTVKTARRERFEEDTVPHLEALWRIALWLTMRRSYAETLVLKTMTQAYCSWHRDSDTAGSKAWSFRILAREFFEVGTGKRLPGRFPPEHGTTGAKGCRRCPPTSIKGWELSLLSNLSDVSVKGATARLRVQSRLIMILLFRERFSYADIAYITNLRRDSVKSTLSRLRRLIPRYLVQNADCFVTEADSHTAFQARGASFDKDEKLGPYELPSTATYESTADAAGDTWENEGGALDSRCRG